MEDLLSVESFRFNASLRHPCHLRLRVIQILVFSFYYYLLSFKIDIVFEALVVTHGAIYMSMRRIELYLYFASLEISQILDHIH